MRVIAFDTETCLIRPALLAPPLVCVTWQESGTPARIVSRDAAEKIVSLWLSCSEITLVGHNISYDMAVIAAAYPALLPKIFKAYAEDRVTDTQIRQQLLDTAGGMYRGRLGEKGRWITHNYTLEDLARRLVDMRLLKDGWRLSYGEFLDTPLAAWPARAREVQEAARPKVVELDGRIARATEAKDVALAKLLTKERDGLSEMIAGDPNRASEYPLDDARATLAVYLSQEKHKAFLSDQYRQARAAFALHLSSAWGIRTDETGLDILERETQAEYDDVEEELILAGFVRNDKKRTRDTKEAKRRMVAVCRELGITIRRTDAHASADPKCKDIDGNELPPGDDACVEHVCLDAEACEATEDELLVKYARITTLKKMLSNDIAAMRRGVRYPLHTRYGWADTGRTTSSKPNIQNVSKRAGMRECYVPRPGCVFVECDFPSLESYCWAQCCVSWLGFSKLAEALNQGLDPHLILAANILRTTYDDARARYKAGDKEVIDVRQFAKVGNFGWPGGMGSPTMLLSVKRQLEPETIERLGLDVEKLEEHKQTWLATWTEAKPYFDRIKAMGPPYPERFSATVQTLFTKRFRGDASYCAACNFGFQALGSDCAKLAAWNIAVAQYDTPSSPLFNTRTVAFVHDEFILEAPEERGHEAALELAEIMRTSANVYLRDVPIVASKMEPLLMRRWSKNAKPIFVEGRLVPWAA